MKKLHTKFLPILPVLTIFSCILSVEQVTPEQAYKKLETKFAWGLSARQGKRPTMEDAHLICNPSSIKTNLLVGIFDGHGGKQVADFAAQNLPLYFSKYGSLKNSFSHIESKLKLEPYAKDMGSTAVVSYIETNKSGDRILTTAWLGDSRAVLVDKYNKVIWASKDHKPNDAQEKIRIEKNGGQVLFYGVPRVSLPGIDNMLAVSRSFGDMQFKQPNSFGKLIDGGAVSGEPEIFNIKLSHDIKFLILACDGVWDLISNEKAAQIVSRELSKQDKFVNISSDHDLQLEESEISGNSQNALDAAIALRDEAYLKGSSDNISVIIIVLQAK